MSPLISNISNYYLKILEKKRGNGERKVIENNRKKRYKPKNIEKIQKNIEKYIEKNREKIRKNLGIFF